MPAATSAPSAVRRLDSRAAAALADLAALFEDLQTVLRCCERLVSDLAAGAATEGEPDDLGLEAFWTTALLSYARCFEPRESGVRLSEEDVSATGLAGDVVGWHQMLLRLRAHQADPLVNPRELFAVGVSQGDDGTAAGVAVTSTRQPAVDDITVRQTGAIAYSLRIVVDKRIGEQQAEVAREAGAMTRAELDRLPVVPVTLADG
jgi:hypothetical protein